MKKLIFMVVFLGLSACGGGGGSSSGGTSTIPSYNGNTFADYNTIQASDVRAIDGDTIEVTVANKPSERIRLAAIDAPESSQPYGVESKINLNQCMSGKTITIKWFKKDKYERLVGYVLAGNTVCNYEQLNTGSAWHYKEYQKEQPEAEKIAYANAEVVARQAKKGLWALPCPIAPWEWRAGKREVDGCTVPTTPTTPTTPNLPSICTTIPKTCGAMSSCTEAYTALQTCGYTSLDSDKDGVPCEAICK